MVNSGRGAVVTSSDISPEAIRYLHINAEANGAAINIIQSDLFENIPSQVFDIIAINPPYYKKDPLSWSDHAWYCGKNGEYFFKLFCTLHEYLHPKTQVFMVLCEGCDIAMIRRYSEKNGFHLQCVQKKRNWVEMNYIYKIEMVHA